VTKPGPVDRAAGSTPALVIGLLANALAVGAGLLSKSVRGWVQHHSLVVFWCAVGLALLVLILWNRYASRLAIAQAAASAMAVELAELKDRTVVPTERDRRAFADLLSFLSWDSGLMRFLDNGFDAKRWRSEQVAPLYKLQGDWQRTFFDDPIVQNAFADLRQRADELADWLAGEGSSGPASNVDVISIAAVHERGVNGVQEYDSTRDEGFRLARAFINSREWFEQVGRAQRL